MDTITEVMSSEEISSFIDVMYSGNSYQSRTIEDLKLKIEELRIKIEELKIKIEELKLKKGCFFS